LDARLHQADPVSASGRKQKLLTHSFAPDRTETLRSLVPHAL